MLKPIITCLCLGLVSISACERLLSPFLCKTSRLTLLHMLSVLAIRRFTGLLEKLNGSTFC